MKRKIEQKLKAIVLREKGYSLNEIIKKIGVAKSSVSVWVRNVPLSEKARSRLLTRIKLGQIIVAELKRKKTQQILDNHKADALRQLKNRKLDIVLIRTICSLIYWCEGTKNHYQGVTFTNSDPGLVKTFLFLLRTGFKIDEDKFRPCIHLHRYHNPHKQLNFWSKVTKISKSQFIKPYLKTNTGKRIKKDYPGCISIKYHSTDVARQLLMTAEVFLSKYGGIV
ncbi:hypothetical protein KKG51_04975 [Patescibacteria group bacterium]|nr:hypothetical protein [Patescibacteria group bacterium]MBU2578192.1 hypothetical protein [Patescibacteria group bacterium]